MENLYNITLKKNERIFKENLHVCVSVVSILAECMASFNVHGSGLHTSSYYK